MYKRMTYDEIHEINRLIPMLDSISEQIKQYSKKESQTLIELFSNTFIELYGKNQEDGLKKYLYNIFILDGFNEAIDELSQLPENIQELCLAVFNFPPLLSMKICIELLKIIPNFNIDFIWNCMQIVAHNINYYPYLVKKYLSEYFINAFMDTVPEFEEMEIYKILSDSVLININME